VNPQLAKFEEMRRRHEEIAGLLNDPAVLTDPRQVGSLSKESGQLTPVVEKYLSYLKAVKQIEDLARMATDVSDTAMAALADGELPEAREHAARLLEELKDTLDTAEHDAVESFFLEIRAGTGGDEAGLFAGDLFEMYRKYVSNHNWRFEVSDLSPSERGGFKEVIVYIKGAGAYRNLRFEGGGHRVQRVPETEAQGRIHTSAATVAVLPELPDVKIEVNPKDVEEFGCRGGGPGGQNVNKVETGWRILHKPSGLQFKITEHKSQAQNKDRAWALLRATLYEREQAKQHAAVTSARKAMMGSGDRSQRIRTYNFPQNRCTDHRLAGGEDASEKNFKLDKIMAGELEPLIEALIKKARDEAG
jgi:peptide chain release factor 1